MGRPAVDAVGVTIAQTREACSLPQRGTRLPAAKDEKRRPRRVPGQLDRQLYERPQSHHDVDGQDGEPMTVTTSLPQGSPVSQVLFAIYIAGIHGVVESQVEDSRGISFVDDVAWVVESTSLDDVVSRLEQCAAASLRQRGALRNVKNRSGPLLREEEPPPL